RTLCDVILMVQERKIPAHRVVLAAASHFFNLMFTTNMLESKSFEVELKDAEPDIIEQLVEFAYTARISVNSNNVQSLLDAANQYQIEPVKKMCISVLAECLDCPELKATADDFIHQHFTEVYKTDEFLQLDVKRVTQLLSQDTLTVRAEDQVYDAAVRWLKYDEPNRQPFMVDILAKVRFPLISKNFLSKTVQAEPLIQDNPECLKMVISKVSAKPLYSHLQQEKNNYERICGTGVMAQHPGGLDNVEYYDIKLNEWKMVSPMPWRGVTVKCAAVGSVIYVLAGFQGVGRLGHILEYNTETDKWIANSKVRAFPVTSCLICVVDTCGANEETLET
ncbi:hypothetical protein STEG23_011574, partial [Scotinomys teguina]